ncbi:3-hydroxybutyrate oligomer hydrolase family protein [Sphaerotilus sp.]|uniref:3-hydroxybutyrate oligomer hydrolase family protein n=1 Tax=Sphaerotilus sp. TaxID=2093942 RepID=UPI00286DD3C1|nr:3-hydroxybutyrate oligomer hydrolase family protein [Sphaerotilus sp.]
MNKPIPNARTAPKRTPIAAAALAALVLGGCASSSSEDINTLPAGLSGAIAEKVYDGATDDLLTAGLGKTGLMGAAPAYAVPATPTAPELRRNAIYNNYRALVDYTAAGGMGVLYGPNIDLNGGNTLGEGKIAGREYIAYADDGTGKQNVTLMVQIPDSFQPGRPCIVTAASSGSRGVYGAIGTAGEWGLKRGCAVAYTDKGSGNGLHDLTSGAVMARDGTVLNAATAAGKALFQSAATASDVTAFNTATPNRVAYKHAHSQQNPEKDWGKHTLDAVRLAFYVLNERYGSPTAVDPNKKIRTIVPANTIVIASSVSNGGGAALAAAEQDTEGLIDGVAVSEPNAQPGANTGLTIQQGAATVATHSKPLLDYFTYANVYQPCAALSAQASQVLAAAFWPAAFTTAAQNRCTALAARGLLTGVTLAAQADAALAKLNTYGWQAESNFFHQSHYRFATNAIAVTYVNTYGRFSVTDSVCGFSMANTTATGDVAAQVAATQAGLFASGNGIPPTGGVNLVYDRSVGGAKLDFLATSPTSGTADFALDGALCLRSLATGKDEATGATLTGALKAQSDRVIAGVNAVQLTAKLRSKPTIIVAGRSDTLLPINHTARAYFGKNQLSDSASDAAKVRYIEVTNAQHFDTFIAFGALLGYDTKAVPLHPYLNQALNAMWTHLTTGAALPVSQVVRTTPRATSATALSAANVPAIATAPVAADQIVMTGLTLKVPD